MRRRHHTDYGKRGGTSATVGRTASLYTYTFPDGRVEIKRSFHVSTPTARAVIYCHEGVWYCAGIVAVDEDGWWSNRTMVEATRKNPNWGD